MPFEIGTKLGKGRPKKRSTVLKEFVLNHPYAYDEMLEMLYELAKKSDREAAQYICDRLRGRPHQSIDNRIRAEIVYTNADHLLAIEEARAYTVKMLEGGSDAIQGRIEATGSQ